ncbi:gp56 dCTPase [Acinetobacter phage Acj9]|uniref:Gp56 dCTPase n=1 Tax=Acinetobacter phage Acj9 TaxID=760939 RepID=E5EPI7_9CAUD|nr:gp56 dCTPase [Acinetobacter phage Acj9]ADG59953.1 gp56 dCTPase [Acinetobacter phage Acj9]
MAHFNQCSQLVDGIDAARQEAENIRFNGEQYLDSMIAMQRALQTKLALEKPDRNANPNNLATAGDQIDWMRKQWDCLSDEFRELLTSFGGMSSGEKDASGVWKDWKANNLEKRATLIKDLSAEDQLEIKFELVDMAHFFLNMVLALDMDAEELFELYYLKNKENFDRQNNGY